MDLVWKDENGNSPYCFINNDDFENYTLNTYTRDYLLDIENDEVKINNFYQKVIPSLCCKYKDKWACLFEPCCIRRVTYATKQTYFRHIQIFHKNSIPGGGLFLTPNSTYFSKHRCKYCGSSFGRKDKLDYHLRNTKSCSKKYLSETQLESSLLTPEVSIVNSSSSNEKSNNESKKSESFDNIHSKEIESLNKNEEPSESKLCGVSDISTELTDLNNAKSVSSTPDASELESIDLKKTSISELFDSDEIPCGQPVRYEPIVQVPDSPELSENDDIVELKPFLKSTPKRSLSSFSLNGDDLKKIKHKEEVKGEEEEEEDREELENEKKKQLETNNDDEDEDDKILLEFISNTKY